MKAQIKRLIFGLLGKHPDAVVVNYATGTEEQVRAMVAESRRLIADRRHLLVCQKPAFEIDGVETVVVRPTWWHVARALRRYRVGMACVLFGPQHGDLRRAAMLHSPAKILAFNQAMETHHLKPGTAVSSWLFVRGVPLDRIHIRPRWLQWMTDDRTTVPDDATIVEGRPPRRGAGRVLLLTPFSPFPLSHGGAVRLFHIIREMARDFDVYLLFFRENEKAADLRPLLDFVTAIGSVSKPRYREPRWATKLPPEVCEYESAPMRALLDRVIRERAIDLVQVEYTQLARYPGDILVEHDVTYDLYAQLRARDDSRAAWWNWKRWFDFETEAVRRYRRVITMSEKDARQLSVPHAVAIPNGVDLARFQPTPEPAGQRILFVGSFRHFPNVTAFRFFVDEVWPLVTARHPDATLDVVAGPDHIRHFPGTLPSDPRIRIQGFVSDVRPLYHASNVVVVPTLVSAGTNVKVLEAMAMKRAIVSTTSGVGGIGVEHNRHVLIADSAEDFAAAVCRLIDSTSLRTRLSEAAWQLARERFDWSRLGEMQRAVMRELLPEPILVRRGEAEHVVAVRIIQQESLPTSRWDPHQYLHHEFYTAFFEHEMAGFVVARRTAPDEREILNIAVRPQFRGRGIAEKLLRRLVSAEPGDVFLEVRESNEVARRVYERVGFRNVGMRPGYYDDPPETAVIMRIHT